MLDRDGLLRTRGFVVDDDQRTVAPLPEIVHCAGEEKIRGGMMPLQAAVQRVAPGVEFGMLKWHRFNAVLYHDGMRYALCSARIEFSLQEQINRAVQGKRRSIGSGDTAPSIEIKAASAR